MNKKPILFGEVNRPTPKKRNTTSRVRRGIRVNPRDLKWLKEEAQKAFPNKRSYKALYIEAALNEFLARESLNEADFENPEDEAANEFVGDLLVHMMEPNLSKDTEIFRISSGIHKNMVGFETKLRRFLEAKLDWFDGVTPIDRIFSGMFRYAVHVKIGKDRTLRTLINR